MLCVLFLLAVVACGEGYALVRFSQDLDRMRKAPPRVVSAPPDHPTDRDLVYGDPILISPKLLRDAPLAADGEGGVIVATGIGNLVRIDPHGQLTQFVEQLAGAGNYAGRTHGSLLIATDVSGNRYQINPGERSISKYDPEGILRVGHIGKDKLLAPTSLTVDAFGNLYLIDDRRVKRIPAIDRPYGGRLSNP